MELTEPRRVLKSSEAARVAGEAGFTVESGGMAVGGTIGRDLILVSKETEHRKHGHAALVYLKLWSMSTVVPALAAGSGRAAASTLKAPNTTMVARECK